MKLNIVITSLLLLLLAAACKKQEDKPPTPATTGSSTPGSAAAAPAAPTPTPVPDEATDRVTVLASHHNRKPTDPVRIDIDTFKVVKANFDPKKIEGGTATIELDLSSLHTGSDERDNHLKSPSYLDVGKLATVTITINNVKPKSGTTYTADATVAAHGMTKTYPVTFDVLETKDDRIRIKGEHTFKRLDFAIGSDPAQNPEEQVGTDATIQMVLTLTK